jgi:serine/threonine protein phosphatase PrpC
MPDREDAVLWGADYTEIGDVGLAAVGEHAAIALSYGGKPKQWPSGSPNEDAAAAVVGRRATLLVIADGHKGYESVPAAVGAVLDQIGDAPPPADLSDDELVDLFCDANDAALANNGGTGAVDESRTTLIVALIAGSVVQWASFGDSEIFLASPQGARSLGEPKLKFNGYTMSRSDLAGLLDRGEVELSDGSWVIAASDGVTDYLGGRGLTACEVIAEVIEPGLEPSKLAEALMLGAFAGGAGDNVGLALASAGSGR